MCFKLKLESKANNEFLSLGETLNRIECRFWYQLQLWLDKMPLNLPSPTTGR